jgi:hypothetical protein
MLSQHEIQSYINRYEKEALAFQKKAEDYDKTASQTPNKQDRDRAIAKANEARKNAHDSQAKAEVLKKQLKSREEYQKTKQDVVQNSVKTVSNLQTKDASKQKQSERYQQSQKTTDAITGISKERLEAAREKAAMEKAAREMKIAEKNHDR